MTDDIQNDSANAIRNKSLQTDCFECLILSSLHDPRYEKYLSSKFPTRSDTNQTARSKKMGRGLTLRIYEVERLYYLCSENTGS